MQNYFCQYRYRNLNACKFHLERHVEYSIGPTADKTNVTLVLSNDFSRAGNTFPWTSASLKITLMESTYPGQRPQSPSLAPHFLLGWHDRTKHWQALNYCLLLAKYCIFCTSLHGDVLDFQCFLPLLNGKLEILIEILKEIATAKKALPKFFRTWAAVL